MILALSSLNSPATAMELTEASSRPSLKLRDPIVIEPALTSWQTAQVEGCLALKRGSRFPVALVTHLDSRTARVGDPVKAMLLTGVSIGEEHQVLIPQGASLSGWVSQVYHSRKKLSSQLSATRWSNANAALKVHFDRVTWADGRALSLRADPVTGTAITSTSSEFDYAVNKRGEISFDTCGVKNTATSVAIGAATIASGPLSLVVGPTLSGAAGAMDPTYALDRPVSEQDQEARVKGLFQGMLKGLPGGSLVLGAKHRGLAVEINSGAQIYLELTDDLVLPRRFVSECEPNASLL